RRETGKFPEHAIRIAVGAAEFYPLELRRDRRPVGAAGEGVLTPQTAAEIRSRTRPGRAAEFAKLLRERFGEGTSGPSQCARRRHVPRRFHPPLACLRGSRGAGF